MPSEQAGSGVFVGLLCCAANLSLQGDAAMFTCYAGHGETLAIGEKGRGQCVSASTASTVRVWVSDEAKDKLN